MYKKIHTYTTDRTNPKTIVRLAVYAVAVELLARLVALTSVHILGAFVWMDFSFNVSDVVGVLLITLFYGPVPLATDPLLQDLSLIPIPVVAFGYLSAVAIVYGVHRRYVSE